MTVKHTWFVFIAAAAITLPIRVYQLFVQTDGETEFLKGAGLTTTLIVAVLAAAILFCFVAGRKDPGLKQSYRPVRSGVAAFFGALAGLSMIFQSVNLVPGALVDMSAAEIQGKPNPGAYICIVLAVFGVAAGITVLLAAYSLLRGGALLRIHPLLALLPSLWGCVCLVLLFVLYTAKVNLSENLYDMLSIIFILLFLFAQAKIFAGMEEERSIRLAYIAGLPAVLMACLTSIPTTLLSLMGRRVPGDFPEGLHMVTLALAAYVIAFLLSIRNLPLKTVPAQTPVGENSSAQEPVQE